MSSVTSFSFFTFNTTNDYAYIISGADVCNINICLTWRIQSDHLDLICRVNALNFPVEFWTNNTEAGFCSQPKPSPSCYPLHKDINLSQNTHTNVTILSLRRGISSKINGPWECRHGTNKDKAIVNVTILIEKGRHLIYLIRTRISWL